MQIKQKNLGAQPCVIRVKLVNEVDDCLAVTNDVQSGFDGMFFECLPHQIHVGGVVFRQQNIVRAGTISRTEQSSLYVERAVGVAQSLLWAFGH